MKLRPMVYLAATLALLIGSSLTANAALVGQWTFQLGSPLLDTQGNFPVLTLQGNASTPNGQLDVNGAGAGATGWAITDITGNYTGPTIIDKTLVSWVTLQGLDNVATQGSALTIDRQDSDHFDGIVFAERQSNRWMNGSTGYQRTADFVPGFQESTIGTEIQMAITYDDLDNVAGGNMLVTGYRNGVQIGQYTVGIDSPGPGSSWVANDAEVIFGKRHTNSGLTGPGALDALINEARIYNEVLTQEQIQALVPLPEPATGMLCLIGLIGFARVARKRS